MNENQPTAFVCPLEWGLGHASRLIPVVHELQRCGYRVVLGGSGSSLSLLKQEFPSLTSMLLPSFNVRYAAGRSQIPKLLLQLPRMLVSMWREQRHLEKLVAEHRFNLVVSDNRYGLFSHNARTVLITHQLSPLLPKMLRWMEPSLHRLVVLLVRRFDACWIPDLPSPEASLSGQLSHRYRMPGNARFIGLLSRFSDRLPNAHIPEPATAEGRSPGTQIHARPYPEMVIVLSGPEPQRSLLFRMLLPQSRATGLRTLFICGLTDEAPANAAGVNVPEKGRGDAGESDPGTFAGRDAVTCVPHLQTDLFHDMLVHADLILCRPGYSSLMDLAATGRTAILIPTPGQTEQEYLAELVSSRYGFVSFRQKDFNLERAVRAYHERRIKRLLPGAGPDSGKDLLNQAIRQLGKKDGQDGHKAQ